MVDSMALLSVGLKALHEVAQRVEQKEHSSAAWTAMGWAEKKADMTGSPAVGTMVGLKGKEWAGMLGLQQAV